MLLQRELSTGFSLVDYPRMSQCINTNKDGHLFYSRSHQVLFVFLNQCDMSKNICGSILNALILSKKCNDHTHVDSLFGEKYYTITVQCQNILKILGVFVWSEVLYYNSLVLEHIEDIGCVSLVRSIIYLYSHKANV